MAKKKNEASALQPTTSELIKRVETVEATLFHHFNHMSKDYYYAPFSAPSDLIKIYNPSIKWSVGYKSSGSFDVWLNIEGENFSKPDMPGVFHSAAVYAFVERGNRLESLEGFPQQTKIDADGKFRNVKGTIAGTQYINLFAIDIYTNKQTRMYRFAISNDMNGFRIIMG